MAAGGHLLRGEGGVQPHQRVHDLRNRSAWVSSHFCRLVRVGGDEVGTGTNPFENSGTVRLLCRDWSAPRFLRQQRVTYGRGERRDSPSRYGDNLGAVKRGCRLVRYLGGSPDQHDVCPISLRVYFLVDRVFFAGYEAQFTGSIAKSLKLLAGIWRSSYYEQFFHALGTHRMQHFIDGAAVVLPSTDIAASGICQNLLPKVTGRPPNTSILPTDSNECLTQRFGNASNLAGGNASLAWARKPSVLKQDQGHIGIFPLETMFGK